MGGLPPILDNQIPSLVHDWASVSRVPFSCRWNLHVSLHAFNRGRPSCLFFGVCSTATTNPYVCRVPSAKLGFAWGCSRGLAKPPRERVCALSSGAASLRAGCRLGMPPAGGFLRPTHRGVPTPDPRPLEKTAGRSIGEILGSRPRTRPLPTPSED